MSTLPRRLTFAVVLAALAGVLLLTSAALASPASAGGQATVAKKAKACKKRKGETRKHWLKRCRCSKFKSGETRAKFRKRCPGAKVPKRKAPAGGGNTAPATPAPTTPPPAAGPLTGQAAIDYVKAAMKGMRISRTSCTSSPSGGCSTSVTENVDFCQDGASFQGRRTREGYSGEVYEVNFAGTYEVREAAVNAERTGAQARVNSTITQATGNDDPPPSGEGVMTFVGTNQVYLGNTEYTRGQAAC